MQRRIGERREEGKMGLHPGKILVNHQRKGRLGPTEKESMRISRRKPKRKSLPGKENHEKGGRQENPERGTKRTE